MPPRRKKSAARAATSTVVAPTPVPPSSPIKMTVSSAVVDNSNPAVASSASLFSNFSAWFAPTSESAHAKEAWLHHGGTLPLDGVAADLRFSSSSTDAATARLLNIPSLVYRIEWIHDCVHAGKLLPIGVYVLQAQSRQYVQTSVQSYFQKRMQLQMDGRRIVYQGAPNSDEVAIAALIEAESSPKKKQRRHRLTRAEKEAQQEELALAEERRTAKGFDPSNIAPIALNHLPSPSPTSSPAAASSATASSSLLLANRPFTLTNLTAFHQRATAQASYYARAAAVAGVSTSPPALTTALHATDASVTPANGNSAAAPSAAAPATNGKKKGTKRKSGALAATNGSSPDTVIDMTSPPNAAAAAAAGATRTIADAKTPKKAQKTKNGRGKKRVKEEEEEERKQEDEDERKVVVKEEPQEQPTAKRRRGRPSKSDAASSAAASSPSRAAASVSPRPPPAYHPITHTDLAEAESTLHESSEASLERISLSVGCPLRLANRPDLTHFKEVRMVKEWQEMFKKKLLEYWTRIPQ